MAVDLRLRRRCRDGRGSTFLNRWRCRCRRRLWLSRRRRSWRSRCNGSRSKLDRLRSLGLLVLTFLNGFFLKETEDIVEDEITIGLLSEEEGLNKLPPRFTLVGHFADDLDDDTAICRRLSVDRVDEDLAILEAYRGDLVVDFLEART